MKTSQSFKCSRIPQGLPLYQAIAAALLTASFLQTGLAWAQVPNLPAVTEGGNSGGGGDAPEARVDEIRTDLLKWIADGKHQGLVFPLRLTADLYRRQMNEVLAAHAVIVTTVTTAQENAATDPELKVSIGGNPKTCRGFISIHDNRKHILCNSERLMGTQATEAYRKNELPIEQYRLIHHEFAGLAGIEKNLGASSDYEISSQITDFVGPETVWRLSANRRSATANGPWDGLYRLQSANGDRASECPVYLQLKSYTTDKYSADKEDRTLELGVEVIALNQGETKTRVDFRPGEKKSSTSDEMCNWSPNAQRPGFCNVDRFEETHWISEGAVTQNVSKKWTITRGDDSFLPEYLPTFLDPTKNTAEQYLLEKLDSQTVRYFEANNGTGNNDEGSHLMNCRYGH